MTNPDKRVMDEARDDWNEAMTWFNSAIDDENLHDKRTIAYMAWQAGRAQSGAVAGAGMVAVSVDPSLLAPFARFCEICNDSDADGYDVPAEKMELLASAGLVRKVRGSVYETTSIGDQVYASLPSPAIERAWKRFKSALSATKEEPKA